MRCCSGSYGVLELENLRKDHQETWCRSALRFGSAHKQVIWGRPIYGIQHRNIKRLQRAEVLGFWAGVSLTGSRRPSGSLRHRLADRPGSCVACLPLHVYASSPGMGIAYLFVLSKKAGLCRIVFGLAKVGQPDADEPVALLWAQGYSFPQPERNLRQLFTGGGRRAGRMAAS